MAALAEKINFDTVEISDFSYIAKPIHMAILALFGRDDFIPNAGWVAKQMSIEFNYAKELLADLEFTGIIELDGDQIIAVKKNNLKVNSTPSKVLRRYHTEHLKIAANVLEDLNSELFDISSATMSLNPEKIDEARELINEFRSKFRSLMDDQSKESKVYHLSVQVYPLQ